jgi:hypothetical protein
MNSETKARVEFSQRRNLHGHSCKNLRSRYFFLAERAAKDSYGPIRLIANEEGDSACVSLKLMCFLLPLLANPKAHLRQIPLMGGCCQVQSSCSTQTAVCFQREEATCLPGVLLMRF